MNKRKTLKRNRTRKNLKRNGTRKNKKTKKRKNIKNKLGGTASASASASPNKQNENQVFSTGDLVKFKFNGKDRFAVVIDKLAVTEKDKYRVTLLEVEDSEEYKKIYHKDPIFGKILLLEQMYMEKATDSELSEDISLLPHFVNFVKKNVKTHNKFLSLMNYPSNPT